MLHEAHAVIETGSRALHAFGAVLVFAAPVRTSERAREVVRGICTSSDYCSGVAPTSGRLARSRAGAVAHHSLAFSRTAAIVHPYLKA